MQRTDAVPSTAVPPVDIQRYVFQVGEATVERFPALVQLFTAIRSYAAEKYEDPNGTQRCHRHDPAVFFSRRHHRPLRRDAGTLAVPTAR